MYSSANDIDIEDFFGFLSEKNQQPVITLNKVTIAHLTSRLENDCNKLKLEPLYNLFDALTNDTDLKRFFGDEGLKFIEKNGQILTRLDGELVDWSDYFVDTKEPVARMIYRRFIGYDCNSIDRCINGFLFNGEIYKCPSVRHIYDCPEIVDNILRVLNKKDAISKWVKNATPYIFVFKADLQDIIFDDDDSLNNEQKQYHILQYCLFYLLKQSKNDWSEYNNPMVRLKSNLNILEKDIIEKVKIE